MLSSLYTSITGLNGFTKALDNLSNNVANLNTPGFKGNDVMFRELGSESYSSDGERGNGLSDDVGSGVRIAGSATRFTQGDVKDTGGDTDLAIEGAAFFVLDGNGTEYYTRSGQFRFDDQGYLVDPGTGYRVITADNQGKTGFLNIKSFETSAPKSTGKISLSGTLNGAATANSVYPAESAEKLKATVFDQSGEEHVVYLSFTKLEGRSWSMSIQDAKGALVAPQQTVEFTSLGSIVTSTSEFQFDYQPYHLLEQDALHTAFDPGTAMSYAAGHSLEVTSSFAVNHAHLILRDQDQFEFTQQGVFAINEQGFLIDPATQLRVAARDAAGKILDFSVAGKLETPAESTGEITVSGNLDSALAVNGHYPPDSESPLLFDYIDDDGETRSLRIRFERAATDRWTVTAEIADGTNVDVSGAIFFNSNGQLESSTSAILIQLSEHGGDDIAFKFSDANNQQSLTSLQQASSVAATSRDGKAKGLLTTVTFDDDGNATLNYSNGDVETGPQLAVVAFDGSRVENLTLDLSKLTSVASGQNSITVGETDGRALGQITSYTFNDLGQLEINYSNGEKVKTDPVALASILDRTKLYSVGDTLFRLQADGQRVLGNAQADNLAKITPHSLELSNVELSREFADIIIVQRGYQASSQVLNVTNQLIEELYNSVKGR
jgi:flagellar hook-basal body protein